MEPIPFEYEGTSVRTIVADGGEPWFVAADIAKILGYRDAHNLARRIDEDDRGTRPVSTPSGVQNMTVISEAGLYSAVLGSQVDGARQFKRWVTHDVLPSIRKRGMYATTQTVEAMLSDPDTMIRLLTEIKEERAARQVAEDKARELEPKARFADAVSSSRTSILVGDLAKILKGNGVETGAQRLFARLREDGYLIRRKGSDWNMPTQRAMELGLFEIKETAVAHSDGHVTVNRTPKVTGKGQTYFVNRYMGEKVIA
ncbi:phage antirepressor [Schaalia cardiffensis]|uniref:phage antirepressor n=1 Tax=Schaalia cardiffensis TaxID=181487 RepID=UPI0023EF84B5|nr:phage antirepressor KilAC domain-containing protein [Schaalia cardiffensis]